jgi:hypothetical protein
MPLCPLSLGRTSGRHARRSGREAQLFKLSAVYIHTTCRPPATFSRRSVAPNGPAPWAGSRAGGRRARSEFAARASVREATPGPAPLPFLPVPVVPAAGLRSPDTPGGTAVEFGAETVLKPPWTAGPTGGATVVACPSRILGPAFSPPSVVASVDESRPTLCVVRESEWHRTSPLLQT